jgi:hypothetical protein
MDHHAFLLSGHNRLNGTSRIAEQREWLSGLLCKFGDDRGINMNTRLVTLLAAGALALSATATMAQQSGAPSNEKDRSGQPTDSSQNAAQPQRPGGAMNNSGTVGSGAKSKSNMNDRTPNQPGGVPSTQPPQGQDTGQSANPRPK